MRHSRVTDNPVGKHVFDSKKVQFAFPGGMLGDIGGPHLVGPACSSGAIMASPTMIVNVSKQILMDSRPMERLTP